jgi:hypothetical protein
MAFINTLYNLWPNGDGKIPGFRDGIAASAQAVFAKYGITTPPLIAHIMAQISHECGARHDVVENLSYETVAFAVSISIFRETRCVCSMPNALSEPSEILEKSPVLPAQIAPRSISRAMAKRTVRAPSKT